jgi:hypothetical protein
MKVLFLISVLALSSAAYAQHEGMQMPTPQQQKPKDQQPKDDQMQGMPGMQMDMNREATLVSQTLHHASAGTTAEPASTEPAMVMKPLGKWNFMLHGNLFLTAQQQSGPRGYDKVFSTSWLMPMVQRDFGRGELTFRVMTSLEPATVTSRYFPELFQQGETAFGKPINDGQHPHDFFMEIAALYDVKLREYTLLSFYVAPMGDPALGPTAFPHRASASEDPLAPLGHHLQDSSHIAADVITVGLTHKIFRIEASGFHGREPDENRWNIEYGTIDSWSTRVTVNPAKNWSMQYSIGQLASPEALHADEDIRRMTASVMYNRAMPHGEWTSTLLYGRNRNLPSQLVWSSYLAESTLRFAERNRVWTRIENVDRTNELLLGKNTEPPGFTENIIGRVQAYSVGYDREFPLVPHLSTALGAQLSWYGVPDSLKAAYGSHPAGVAVFLRLRPIGNMQHH